jgi:hypothetical protein
MSRPRHSDWWRHDGQIADELAVVGWQYRTVLPEGNQPNEALRVSAIRRGEPAHGHAFYGAVGRHDAPQNRLR